MNADAAKNTARREKGATKKRKDQTHHTNNNNKRSRFKPQPKTRTTRVRLVTRRTSSFNNTPNNTPQRGRESTRTVCHSCHRPRVPGRHVLIERRSEIKHCKKREGCNKEKKDQTHHHTNNNKRSRFKPQPKKIKRSKRVRSVTQRSPSYRIYSTTHHRVHLLLSILVTAPVFQVDTF